MPRKRTVFIIKENAKDNIGITATKKQIEIMARAMLPEIKEFFADKNNLKEFEAWVNNTTLSKHNK